MSFQEVKGALLNYLPKDLVILATSYIGTKLSSPSYFKIDVTGINNFMTQSDRGYLLDINGNLFIYDLNDGSLLDQENVGNASDITIFNGKIYLIVDYYHVVVLESLRKELKRWKLEEVKDYSYRMTTFRNELYICDKDKDVINVFNQDEKHLRTIKLSHSLYNLTVAKDFMLITGFNLRTLTHEGHEIRYFGMGKYVYESVIVHHEIYAAHRGVIGVYSFDGDLLRTLDVDDHVYKISHTNDNFYIANKEGIFSYKIAPA